MARFLLPPEAWGADAVLPEEEGRHVSQVLRARVGDAISVFDGKGRSARAEIAAVSRHEVRVRLGPERVAEPPRPAIVLAQAVTKGKTMDLIVQKAVELGVTRIQPLLTRHAVVQIGEREADRKSSKWQRVAIEACKQCGQDFVPEVSPAEEIRSWLGRAGEGLKIVASLRGNARPMREVLREAGQPSQVTLLIGPEGDFSEEEVRQAQEAGYFPVSFGTMVLRSETAAFFGLAAVRFEYS